MGYPTHHVRIPYPNRHGRSELTRSKIISDIFQSIHTDRKTPTLALPVSLPPGRTSPTDLGDAIFVHGTFEQLVAFKTNSNTSKLVAELGLEMGDIRLSSHELGHVRLKRSRDDVNKMLPSRKRRLEKRVADGLSTLTAEEIAERAAKVAKRTVEPKPFFSVYSTTQLKETGIKNNARVYVQAKVVHEPGVGEFDSYGLSKGDATVPYVA